MSVNVYLGTNRYLYVCAHATLATLRVAHSRGERISSRIRQIMCDSNHFTFLELSRWSVLYSEINTLVNVALVKSSQLWGERAGGDPGENNIWQGFVRVCPLR